MENEIWKTIPGYSLYQASNMGRIKTFNWKNKGIEAVMRPALGEGYLKTVLKRDVDGKFHPIKVHRIIGLTFIPNINNKPQINHKNGIRSDNRVVNLEWVTHSENIKDSFDSGRSSNKGINNPAAQLTEEQVREIRKIYIPGNKGKSKTCITRQNLADKYGVSLYIIKNIVNKRTWKHLL
jgi:hypothetical protein